MGPTNKGAGTTKKKEWKKEWKPRSSSDHQEALDNRSDYDGKVTTFIEYLI